MKTTTALAAILIFALLVACGPATPSSTTGERPGYDTDPASTPRSVSPQGSTPVPPTATPIPPTDVPPPPVDPTPTPKPTPARPPEDPPGGGFKPESKPAPIFPTEPPPTPVPTPSTGIALCYDLNMYGSTIAEMEYFIWCFDELQDDVSDNCHGIGNGTSASELACAQERLASVQMSFLRESGLQCFAISNQDDLRTCYDEASRTAAENRAMLWSTWAEISATVEADPDVKTRKVLMADCVAGRGYARPDPEAPLRWQENKPRDQQKPATDQTEEDLPAEHALLLVMDECAVNADLYAAQETVWVSELLRLAASDPSRVQPLLDDGVKVALDADGPAPFLMPRK